MCCNVKHKRKKKYEVTRKMKIGMVISCLKPTVLIYYSVNILLYTDYTSLKIIFYYKSRFVGQIFKYASVAMTSDKDQKNKW